MKELLKDERIEELTQNYTYVSVKEFCKLKEISKRSYYHFIKNNNLERKIIKGKTYIKLKIEIIDKKIPSVKRFIDNNNKLNIINLSFC